MFPHTLSDLLHIRASENHSTSRISFLGPDGQTSGTMTYKELYDESLVYSRRLLAAGLKRSDIVLASFPDHESHIRLFWACCLAGILFCPLPGLHPDQSRQVLLFEHLQSLFQNPTLFAPRETIDSVLSLVPNLATFNPNSLLNATDDHNEHLYPAIRPSPNDIVCLMLTSGSTGNSKAVALRHYNLLSSIRGKVEHHDSSSHSRFLNWIAFDHVACVTEIHLHALQADAWSVALLFQFHKTTLTFHLASGTFPRM